MRKRSTSAKQRQRKADKRLVDAIDQRRRELATPPSSQPLRLQTELIPAPLWGMNIRSAIGKKRWRRLRDAVTGYQKGASAICAICESYGDKAPLQGHEVWSYTEKRKTGTATLLDIRLVCQDCSSIHHFGRFQLLLADKVITREEFERVMQHMLRVNGCTIAEWEKHAQEVQEAWQRRSELRWKVDYGMFRWAVDYLATSAAAAHIARETRKRYELFRLLDYDPKAMQAWIDMMPEERGNFDNDPEEFAEYVHYTPEPELWEYRGIDPGEAHMWWLWH